MKVEILGAESLGVRGLCCVVRTRNRYVVIDPGVALGFSRHGLMPHPVQVIASEITRKCIIRALKEATDIVISHYHGDHIPLVDANPYQLSAQEAAGSCGCARFWTKGTGDVSYNQIERAKSLAGALGRTFTAAEGMSDGALAFSSSVPHGKRDSRGGNVMMTCVYEDGETFVHASDIQMLNDAAVDEIIAGHPTIVIASGPPVYLPGLTLQDQEDAYARTIRLAKKVDTLILDHHLMRSEKGARWLDHVSALSGGNVICAADFMGLGRNLLEAERGLWYEKLPVPDGWHQAYARGEIDVIAQWADKVEHVRMR